ncbi:MULTISPECIES: anti-sigma factor domain-containing protein [Sphingobacterium]|uniref:anti-sigma factor n=1 Tax=Sphingobacterium TaxID=28453 RepID=UPI0013D8E7FB|nr:MULTISPECIES: anti-sigma factor [unclassified Sphingobacterium]
MDIKEYISSGIIESYVMGLASEEEVSVLECIRLKHPEVQLAIREAQVLLEDLATTQAIYPEANLKQSVWDKIQEVEVRSKNVEISDDDKDIAAAEFKTSEKQESTPPTRYFVAASVVLALSLLGNLYLYQRTEKLGSTLVEIANNQRETELKLLESERKWALLNRPSVHTVTLNGVESHPSLRAFVLWDSQESTVYLSAASLPKAPKGKQYQLWALVDGVPVDAGVIPSQNNEVLVRMRNIEQAQAFAITLEKEGGTPQPTLTEMYVIGNI